MIVAFVVTVIIGICAVALIGLEDSHNRVSRLLEELDEQAAQRTAQNHHSSVVVPITAVQQDAEQEEVAFTRSLLALNKVGLLTPCDSPVSARAGSSSSESVRPVQSTDPVQVL